MSRFFFGFEKKVKYVFSNTDHNHNRHVSVVHLLQRRK